MQVQLVILASYDICMAQGPGSGSRVPCGLAFYQKTKFLSLQMVIEDSPGDVYHVQKHEFGRVVEPKIDFPALC